MTEQQAKSTNRNYLLMALPILLVILGWGFVVYQSRTLEDTAIRTYQDAQSDIVENAARAAKVFIQNELDARGTDPEVISDVEQFVLQEFVTPIRIGELGDAWIYSPEYVIYDQSADFPEIYRGKSMGEIFEIQAESGAYHYEEMAEAVMAGEEGVGFYIWDPQKANYCPNPNELLGETCETVWWEFLVGHAGHEIAAWTPVKVFEGTEQELVWVIGMSSMLPGMMREVGAYAQIQNSMMIMTVVTIIVMGLMISLFRAERQVQELKAQVAELKIEIDEAKAAQQVAEIVDSEYFQDLAAQSKNLRERRKRRKAQTQTKET